MAAVTQSNDGKRAASDAELATDAEAAETQPAPQGAGPGGPRTPVVARGAAQPGGPRFFTIYKKGHGYWTRMGTAFGAAFIGLMFSFELYDKIPTFLSGDQSRDRKIAMTVAGVFLVAYSIWVWWFMNKQTTVDFLIATDSEMKKVNWTTRKELIGSTKIVILFMFLISMYLFLCDLLFGGFFHMIHVLRTWF
jgi:preprotein translocase SecE subunit